MACAPIECFEVTRMCSGERLEMRMMQPFDLSVSSYGGAECFEMLSHCHTTVPSATVPRTERQPQVRILLTSVHETSFTLKNLS